MSDIKNLFRCTLFVDVILLVRIVKIIRMDLYASSAIGIDRNLKSTQIKSKVVLSIETANNKRKRYMFFCKGTLIYNLKTVYN